MAIRYSLHKRDILLGRPPPSVKTAGVQCWWMEQMTPKIGIALGGGGAKGLAHIPVLEAIDTLGLKVSVMAGTSVGAVIGAMYASGISGADIRKHVASLLATPRSFEEALQAKRFFGWMDL